MPNSIYELLAIILILVLIISLAALTAYTGKITSIIQISREKEIIRLLYENYNNKDLDFITNLYILRAKFNTAKEQNDKKECEKIAKEYELIIKKHKKLFDKIQEDKNHILPETLN